MSKTVNEIELADQVASMMMDECLKGDPWLEQDPLQPEGNFVIMEKHRDQYDTYYDYVCELIDDCEE